MSARSDVGRVVLSLGAVVLAALLFLRMRRSSDAVVLSPPAPSSAAGTGVPPEPRSDLAPMPVPRPAVPTTMPPPVPPTSDVPATRKITGRVVAKESGRGLSGASIVGNWAGGAATSDADGAFTLPVPQELGVAELTARAADRRDVQRAVEPGDPQNVEFVLEPVGRLRGQVVAANGKPAPGTEVYAGGELVVSSPTGEFAFDDLSLDVDLAIGARGPLGVTAQPVPFRLSASRPMISITVPLVSELEISVRVVRPDGATPVGNATVYVEHDDHAYPPVPVEQTTGADGRCTVRGLRPGLYRVTATAEDFDRGVRRSVAIPTDGTDVTVPLAARGEHWTSGTVVTSAGTPVLKGLVSISMGRGEEVGASLVNGRFRVDGLSLPLYMGAAFAVDKDPRGWRIEVRVPGLVGASEIAPIDRDATYVVEKPMRIVGRLVRPDGTSPPAKSVVSFGPATAPRELGAGLGTHEGFCADELVPGDGRFRISGVPRMAGRLRFTVPGRLPFLAPVRAPRADETEVDVGSIVSREGGRFEGRVLISGEIPPSFPWPILLLSGEDDQLAYGGVVGLVGTTVRTDNEVPAGHWTVRLLAAGIVSDVVEVDVEDGRSTPIALAAWHEAQVVVRLGESIDAASQVELAYRGPHETAYRERRRCGRKSSPDGVGGVLCDSPDPDRTWNAVTRTHRFLRLPPGDYVVRLSGGATAAVERAVHLLEGATVVVDLDAPR